MLKAAKVFDIIPMVGSGFIMICAIIIMALAGVLAGLSDGTEIVGDDLAVGVYIAMGVIFLIIGILDLIATIFTLTTINKKDVKNFTLWGVLDIVFGVSIIAGILLLCSKSEVEQEIGYSN